MTTVLVTGTFDMLHPGHIDFFRQARQFGDRLVVLVARDDTVMFVKGKMPFHPEKRRLEMVLQVPGVDEAFLGSLTDYYGVLDQVRPDFICLGYDQRNFIDKLETEIIMRNLKTRIVRLKPFHPEKWKSSKLKDSLSPT